MAIDKSKNHANLNREGKTNLHISWVKFIMYCKQLKYGEIEKLQIQDGLPVFAEKVKEKIKFV